MKSKFLEYIYKWRESESFKDDVRAYSVLGLDFEFVAAVDFIAHTIEQTKQTQQPTKGTDNVKEQKRDTSKKRK